MDNDEDNNISAAGTFTNDLDSQCAVNSLILDYYKKFGRKRDLEQFFSLSTAQGEIKDTSGLFWRKMKSENDSSDSGGRKSDPSAHELCRISIRCSMPEGSSSQSDDPKTKIESPNTESPPIITDDGPADLLRQTDDESFKSDDNHSQKSFDPLLDLSANKAVSPTSSITSQRKLEWDSLADVGYANETDRKTSASSLSTLERLALKQQYSNNDSNQEIGQPTCHSTPVEENEAKSKIKKSGARKMTKIIKKDVDFVEFNLPHTTDANPSQSINVNLTKHISFNVEKDGGISFDNCRKDVNISPEKATINVEETSHLPLNKEIQTSLPKTKDKSCNSVEELNPSNPGNQKIPIVITLNTLRKRLRLRKSRVARRRTKTKKKKYVTEDVPPQEKSGEQLSEAESFEYMPGHIYSQNQMKVNEDNEPRQEHNTAGNKSSLESSGGLTTDSSKGSKHSLTQDLEKCINVLKLTLQKRYDDSETKKKLIKDIVQRLLSSKYRDDDTSTEFLSGLSFNSKKIDLKSNNTTTSTSDANNTDENKEKRPRKSILRMENFDPNIVASTSQSVPNLYTATSTEKIHTNPTKVITSYSESDESSKGKTSSDNALPKTSSEQLYLKYLEALRREESYKRHLRDKEMFLKQKLGTSVINFKASNLQEVKINNRLKDLMKDLTRNNYDDGSGDASKLEGGSTSDRNCDVSIRGGRSQRSHSVFTLSSSHSEGQKKPNLKKKMLADRELDAGTSKNHYCCCPHHFTDSKVAYADSSVQVNIKYQYENENNVIKKQDLLNKCSHCEKYGHSIRDDECTCNKSKLSPRNIDTDCPKCGKGLKTTVPDHVTNIARKHPRSPRNITRMVPNQNYDINSICVCNDNQVAVCNTGEYAIYPCSKLPTRGIRFGESSNILNTNPSSKSSEADGLQFLRAPVKTEIATDSSKSDSKSDSSKARKCSQSSQTDMSVKLHEKSSDLKPINSSSKNLLGLRKNSAIIHEATRCLQTEISINPQISDPTLSDIVIISNCAELIWEQDREVNRSNTKNSDQRTFSDVFTSSESGKFLLRSGREIFDPEVKDSDTNITESKDCVIEPPKNSPNDYAIPIEGTNMTLVVSLASKEIKERTDQIDQAVGTEKSPIADQGTCIAVECAKSAQCQASTIADSTRSTCCSSEHSSNKISRCRPSLKTSSLSKPSTKSSPQRNTYPKEFQLKDKKQLRRSNTDTGKLETQSGGYQTEPLNIGLGDPGKQLSNEVKTSEHSCQVSDTYYDKIMLRSGNDKGELTETKEIGVQKDLSKSELFDTKSVPEMVSKSVGSDAETVINSSAGSYKANTKESLGNAISKKTCKSCGGNNERDCMCRKVAASNATKTKCVKCGNDDTHGCDCENSKTNNVIKSSSKVCGHDDSLSCNCRKNQVPDPKTNKCGECDEFNDCKHRNVPESSPKQTTCIVCAGDVCHCNENDSSKHSKEKRILRTDISKGKPCEKCGSLGQCQCDSDSNGVKDPIMDIIKDITRRYSKNEIMKIKKKKCFTEIITVLNYLLETDESTDQEPRRVSTTPEISDSYEKKSVRSKTPTSDEKHVKASSNVSKSSYDKNANIRRQSPKTSSRRDNIAKKPIPSKSCDNTKEPVGTSESACLCKHGKSDHRSSKCTSKDCIESSDIPCSTDLPSTSDSTACKILKKIKRECEKYHLRRNKCGRKCEISSSTSVNCDQCKQIHYCGCRHKCKRSKLVDKLQKKCVAYNLILQTSESMLSEPTTCDKGRPLKNVIIKVPKCKDKFRTEVTKETVFKTEKGKGRNYFSPRVQRSRSCPKESELSSTDDVIRRTRQYTVREYLEKNRPDFVEKSSERQTCLKYINEMRANERAANRDLLSLHVHREPDLTTLSTEQLRELAQQIGFDLRRRKTAPKFMSEHEMKTHSKNIYKTLPEVVQKKEEKKKENIKKTNLLMANIFKKNLQKNTLRGAVNLSNYSTVIKI